MNNKKKKSEELLEDALIPMEEQPYGVPENWIWVRTGTVNDIITGSTPPKANEDYYGGDFPFIKPADLEQGNQVIIANEYLSEKGKMVSRIIPKESTLVCCIGSIGKVGFSLIESATNQQINSLIPNHKVLEPKFNYYQVLNTDYQTQLWKRSSATTISIINKSKMSEIPMALPPLNEQKRIAEKVKSLLEKIEEAKQFIEKAKETFELRRAAILDKAFRGELTKKWRHENPELIFLPMNVEKVNQGKTFPESWVISDFQSIAANEKYSLAIGPFGSNLKVTDYKEEGIPLIFVRNIRSSNFNLEPRYISVDKANELEAHTVKSGDVLITKMGDPPGDATLCPEYIEKAVITSDCIKITVNPEVTLNSFVMYAIQAPFVHKQIIEQAKGVAQQKISLEIFKKMQLPIPSIKEQEEIVKYIEKYMNSESETLLKIELMLDAILKLEQSILSRAYRGELGTNDPSEENAIGLLKEVLQGQ
ncbi:restriction endonuclease subunit S [Paenibacillus sp. GCM10023248]|uniref:restriction endonuclease subunit S n=1 Tax=unclassified Paenibacillus TaxID=185978 RepID=UPI0023782C91|nr:restriction endonuclease subunit S [Paenibacillus sp. MAHUQ-63]MDD9267856.1 restriction endonuclease subunit S [Paenibacillus sp. MAHUQ-63]